MYIDIGLTVIILICVIFGIKKGFILEFFSLFGVIISGILAKFLVMPVYTFFNNNSSKIQNPKYIFVYIGTFFVIFIVLFIILFLTKKLFEKIMLGWLDRLGGGLLGFLRGSLISLVILIVIVFASKFNDQLKSYLKESYSGKLVEYISPAVVEFFPDEIKESVNRERNKNRVNKIIKDVLKENRDKIDLKEELKKFKDIKFDDKEKDEINKIIEKELKNIDLDKVFEDQ